MRGRIILSHGSDSSPDATKVSALAALAGSLGWDTLRTDHRSDDARGLAGSVAPRIARLRASVEASAAPPVLVGSSLGAFAAGLASLEVPVAGLFLLATPSAIPGYARPLGLREGVPALLVHGWRDEVCPPGGVQAFAARRRLPLLMLDDDHRLTDSLDMIAAQFRHFLATLAVAA
ncbi:alpha/beta hydrolase [Fulvimonas sp. R45]|uniref:alpha/beta hydrolase n=1 Tax=Fulvimonas sp. R45 TaxID=3045937 RepID=UPI00265FFF65|nr:alpha/beta hydrolase [Fulvimonas sp. R45]MDO1529960.1 alpha/beta hydrolase [Fulvimonas sp. R45]